MVATQLELERSGHRGIGIGDNVFAADARATDNAIRAERTSRAVKDYMVSVFQGADPEISGQRDLPVSALLDAGRERLQGALKDDPRSHTELSSILGTVYQSIGKRDQALALFDEAIEQARRQSWHPLLAEALHKKAYSLYDMGEFNKALAPAREALELRERYAVESAERVHSMRLLGSILGYSGETEEALPMLSKALELATRLGGADSIEAGVVHLDLARYFGDVGGHADLVLEHSELAAKSFAQHLGAGHFRVSDALEMRVLGLAQSNQAVAAVLWRTNWLPGVPLFMAISAIHGVMHCILWDRYCGVLGDTWRRSRSFKLAWTSMRSWTGQNQWRAWCRCWVWA
ncbi:MAG: tetratricopeptide repeat protein [Ahniella sp.]|nr:tetratricopeptide repeat protein [Ahniella sp.]